MKRKKILEAGCGVFLMLVLWAIASETGLFGRMDKKTAGMLFPAPWIVGARLVETVRSGYLLLNVWVSFQRVLIGFGIAVVIGLPVGVFMGLNETLRNMLQPVIRFIAPIPGVAWIPLAILWFGLGNQAAIFIIVVGCLSPIIVNTYQGMQNVDAKMMQVLAIMEADVFQKLRYCLLPSIAPYVFSGFRLGLGFAWRVVIAAEMVGVPRGLGYVLSVGRSTGDTPTTFMVILVLGLIMMLMEEVLFGALEKRMNRWKNQE